LALHKPTGKLVAVKVLQSNPEQDGTTRKMVLNEVRTVFQVCEAQGEEARMCVFGGEG
jgi:hypothetical protein